jgi:hypothetical protein
MPSRALTAAASIKPTSAGVLKTGTSPLPHLEAVSASLTIILKSALKPGTKSDIDSPFLK